MKTAIATLFFLYTSFFEGKDNLLRWDNFCTHKHKDVMVFQDIQGMLYVPSTISSAYT